MTDAHQEEVDLDEDEEVVYTPKLVKDEEDPPNPQLDPLEVAMPTDVLPSQPSQPPSASDPSQPTQPASASACAASLYPHSVTTAANIPLNVNPLSSAPPLPDASRGRSSGTPQQPAEKMARITPSASSAGYTPSHLLRFNTHFDPTYNQDRHDVLS